MKSIELIVHCYAVKRPVFASMLTAQLSSLVLWPPKCRVHISICTAIGDFRTLEVGEQFAYRNRLSIDLHAMETELLFRRAIGRNYAAKRSKADIAWFADADYLFGEGCLDALSGMDFSGCVFPCNAQIHRGHALGDAELARVKIGEIFQPNMTLFEPWKCKMAIGGLQIVPGDLARNGYLDGTKWCDPVPTATDFLDTKDDKAYRNSVGGSKPIELPNLYRLRHSESAFEPAEKRLAQTAGKI